MLPTLHPRTPTVSFRWRIVGLKAIPVETCPFKRLGISKGATRAEIRAAYIQKMKDIHPDVNQGDTTQCAAAVNLAYETLCSQASSLPVSSGKTPNVLYSKNCLTEGWQSKDVFDEVGNPEILFVNPFRCSSVNPLEWRALQSAARSESQPEMALFKNGIAASDGAIVYLTRDQMDAIEQEMDRLFQTLDFEFCSWILDDALSRVRNTNGISS